MIRCIVSINGKPIFEYSGDVRSETVPYAPLSHPFVERLIGTLRREYLRPDPLCWTTTWIWMQN